MDGKNLSNDWDKNMAIKRKEKMDDEERTKRIQETMKQMIRKQLEDVEIEKEKKRQEHLKYQRDLDMQLEMQRGRSLQALRGTQNK